MEAQPRQIFFRVLRLHESTRRMVDKVIEPRQKEAHGGTAREKGKGSKLACLQRSHLRVGLQKTTRLRDVERTVILKAPGVDANPEVVGEGVVAGEVEVDEAGEAVADKEDIVGKEIGMNDAGGQVARQSRASSVSSLSSSSASPG